MSFEYFHRRVQPYWRRKGAQAGDSLTGAEYDYPAVAEKCRLFDEELTADLRRAAANTAGQGARTRCASVLISEICCQQLLSQAEDGRLSVTPEAVGTLKLVQTAAAQYRERSESKERTILVDPLSDDLQMETDPAILSGVLGKMLKNAIAATEPGGTVTIGCEATQGGIEFCVHNPGVIPRAAQLQIFQGPLSAKGGGRLPGTYSMRLLTERYLGGTVRFESSSLHGTRFVAHYPAAVVNAAVEAVA